MLLQLGRSLIAAVLALSMGAVPNASLVACAHSPAQSQLGDRHAGHGSPADANAPTQEIPCGTECSGDMACAVVMSCTDVLVVAATHEVDLASVATAMPVWAHQVTTALVAPPEPPPPRA